MTETSNPWAVPAWLVEAWETGEKSKFRTREELVEEILQLRLKVLKNKRYYDSLRESDLFTEDDADQERMSFNLWRLNALAAKLGWMEVQRDLEAQGKTYRIEDGD